MTVPPDTDNPPGRSPGIKLVIALAVAFFLTIPLFTVYLLVYDRQSQSQTAKASVTEGWGGPQVLVGPLLIIPYQKPISTTEMVNGQQVTKTSSETHELVLSPEAVDMTTNISPDVRKRSIYEAVVYSAHTAGKARFALPSDFARSGVDPATLQFDKAELRFGIADPRGISGALPTIKINGQPRELRPGKGPAETNGAGFYTWFDATPLKTQAMFADFSFDLRGNESLAIVPRAGDTRWAVTSIWPSPSFQGGFLPDKPNISANGFSAVYRQNNLSSGNSLVDADVAKPDPNANDLPNDKKLARVNLVTPVDLYDQVNRSVKYGFLFIGFTFMAFLLFDLIGGVRVSTVEYLLVGAGLILFFVMLLAFAEVIGFTWAYLVAAGAIVGLLTAYSAAVLASRKRASFICLLLAALYGVLYILLSLEAYSLLIGSLLLFAALAMVMYLTRNIDWGRDAPAPAVTG